MRRAISDPALTQQSTGLALATLVELESPDQRRNWSRAYVEVVGLIDDARTYAATRIDSFGDSPHAKTFAAILAVFNGISLDNGWPTYSQQLTHLANIALPFVVHDTDGIEQPAVIQSELLTGLRRDLDALLDKVLGSALPADFKEEFARTIGVLRDSMIRIHVHGPEGIARAAALVVGTMAVNDAARKSDPTVVKETLDIISKVQDVFLKSFKIGKIGAAVWRLLSSGI
jgi:hypothetical protein